MSQDLEQRVTDDYTLPKARHDYTLSVEQPEDTGPS